MAGNAAARVDIAVTERRETLFVSLAIAHAAALLTFPSVPLIALGLWWNGNTISHNFIHRPFFRSAAANRAFSAFLSLVLGVPQSLWRKRHLEHHAGTSRHRGRPAPRAGHLPLGIKHGAIVLETMLVLSMWAVLIALAPRFWLFVYLPGWALGLALCQLQGHFEHARGTTSHYGRVYNFLFFNDGYHEEHHLRPGVPWSELPRVRPQSAHASRWPSVLRWLEHVNHGSLEHLVLRSPALQRLVLRLHDRAFRSLLPRLGPVARITIIGGGLFPRTALILRRLLPHATITILDASADNLASAERLLNGHISLVLATHTPGMTLDADLVVLPLAYRGDRKRVYLDPPAAKVLVHDWIWSPRPITARVSWWLLKRINLIQR